MKRIVFYILLFSTLLSCRKDDKLEYKECYSEISTTSELHFADDFKAFGIERLASDSGSVAYAQNPIYRHEVSIYILGKLSSIFNAATEPESPFYKPIFEYQIHKKFGYSTNHLALKFKSDEDQWKFYNHPEQSTNQLLRELIDEKGFKVDFMANLGPYEWIILKSEHEYVQQIFADRLMQYSEIDTAFAVQTIINDYNDIEYGWTNEYDEFTFIYGMGDCPSGCTEFHYWKIRVDKNCNVSLVSEYGAPLPG